MVHPYDGCRELLRQEAIVEQTREAASIARELYSIASKHKFRETTNGASIRSIQNRSLLLGKIGSLSKSLIGTMNEGDAKYINSQIDQQNLTRLIGKQMHITASRIQQLHDKYINDSRPIETLYAKIDGLG